MRWGCEIFCSNRLARATTHETRRFYVSKNNEEMAVVLSSGCDAG